jgi:hypothetical protein
MHLNNLKIIAALLDLKVSSLRVYIANDYFPYVKLGNRVFVTNETLENLKWMKEQGLPLSQYNGMRGKPFKDGRGSMTEWNEYNKTKPMGERSSGMGDNGSDSTTDVYDAPKELIIWGEDQTTMSVTQLRKKVSSLLEELKVYEDALREKDKGYTGRTIVPSAPGLVGELQETIAEQERQIERFEKFIKKHSPLLIQEMRNSERGLAGLRDADKETLNKIIAEGDKFTPQMLEEAVRLQNKLK